MTGPLDRRAFLRTAALGAAAAVMVACARSTTPDPSSAPTAPDQERTAMPTTAPSHVLLAYFSRAGENYWYGDRRDLEVGNTEVLATMLADRLGCDVYRIDAADPYPHDYEQTVARNVREQQEDARPAIVGELPDVSGYDTVILASPIWNVQPPMILATFIEAVDLSGKRLLPVVTYAVSGMGSTVDFYDGLLPGVALGQGLAVRGEEVADDGAAIDGWLADVLPR